MKTPVITIDGPTASGKGTLAKRLAQSLGWHYLDSGALYRALAIQISELGLSFKAVSEVAEVAESLPVSFGDDGEVILAGKDVTSLLREEKTGKSASEISKYQEVRSALLKLQLSFREGPGLVTDGRDMGTVVFPDAVHKFFLIASPEVRAQRRFNQLQEMGINATLAPLIEDIRLRDERDKQRSVSPLIPAEDAEIIDSSDLAADQVLDEVLKRVQL